MFGKRFPAAAESSAKRLRRDIVIEKPMQFQEEEDYEELDRPDLADKFRRPERVINPSDTDDEGEELNFDGFLFPVYLFCIGFSLFLLFPELFSKLRCSAPCWAKSITLSRSATRPLSW